MNTRLITFACVLLTLLAMTSRGAIVAQADDEVALKVKAGMVLNFIRYTEWPAQTFSTRESPLVVTIVGESPLNAQIVSTFTNQRVHDRSVEVRTLQYPMPKDGAKEVGAEQQTEFAKQLKATQVAVIVGSDKKRIAAMLNDLDNTTILTIGDVEDFASNGGMIGLTVRNDRVAFDANQKKIEDSKLKVSSQVLRLARIVASKGVAK